jgi:hypothetical protein
MCFKDGLSSCTRCGRHYVAFSVNIGLRACIALMIVARSAWVRRLSSSARYVCVALRAERRVACPRSVSVNVIRLLSFGLVRRIAKLRATSPSINADIEGSINPMYSATSDSDAPLCWLKKCSVRNCGTDNSGAPYFLN